MRARGTGKSCSFFEEGAEWGSKVEQPDFRHSCRSRGLFTPNVISMWTDASTTAMWTQLTTSVGTNVYTAVAAVLLLVAGLLVIGYFVRIIRRHVTGKKF